jgi:hypothetical protein
VIEIILGLRQVCTGVFDGQDVRSPGLLDRSASRDAYAVDVSPATKGLRVVSRPLRPLTTSISAGLCSAAWHQASKRKPRAVRLRIGLEHAKLSVSAAVRNALTREPLMRPKHHAPQEPY